MNMVRFSPDGNWIISAGDDGRVKVIDTFSFEFPPLSIHITFLRLILHADNICQMNFS